MTTEIGSKLKYWRSKKGLTMRGLSLLSGMSFSFIGRVEVGSIYPNVRSTAKILWAMSTKDDIDYQREIPRILNMVMAHYISMERSRCEKKVSKIENDYLEVISLGDKILKKGGK